MNPTATPRPSVLSVIVPTEHGGWGFLLEPVLLGLLVAPSGAGVWLALAALFAFLSRQPLKLAWTDVRRGRRYPRTLLAVQFAFSFGVAALLALVIAASSTGSAFWAVLAWAVPLGLFQVWFEARNQGRALLPEVAGSLALAAVAPAIVVVGGWPLERAWPLSVIVAARAVPSIQYVRARLRLERGEHVPFWPTVSVQLIAVAALNLLAFAAIVPWLAALAIALLAVRALYGLTGRRRRATRAVVIGVQELAFGLLVVVLAALGYTWGI